MSKLRFDVTPIEFSFTFVFVLDTSVHATCVQHHEERRRDVFRDATRDAHNVDVTQRGRDAAWT